jgi:hypothetical protein
MDPAVRMSARVTDASGSAVDTATVTGCPGCGGTRLTGDGYRFKRVREWRTGRDGYPYRLRWAGYCSRCADEAERARLRDLRLASRAATVCARCGTAFTPLRADARYCSSPCRQRAYRMRVKHP